MHRGSTEVLNELHEAGLCLGLVPGFPSATLVATIEELGAEPDMRAVVLERWRSALSLSCGMESEATAAMAALSDVVAAVVQPVVTALLIANEAVVVEPHRVAIGWGTGARVVGAGWLEPWILGHAPPSLSWAAARDALFGTLAPLIEAFCGDGAIPLPIGWSVVTDSVRSAGREVCERRDDTPAAVTEVVRLLDGDPFSDRGRPTVVTRDRGAWAHRERNTCCDPPTLAGPGSECRAEPAVIPPHPWQVSAHETGEFLHGPVRRSG